VGFLKQERSLSILMLVSLLLYSEVMPDPVDRPSYELWVMIWGCMAAITVWYVRRDHASIFCNGIRMRKLICMAGLF